MTFLATLASEPGGLAALAIELPNWITPSIAGLTVGAVVGVIGFVSVLLLLGREKRPLRRIVPPLSGAGSGLPDNVVFIPPYTTLPRDTPVPAPWMGQHPSTPPGTFPAAHVTHAPWSASGSFPVAPNRGAPPLRPSTELSARVFAKMGYSVDAAPQTLRSEPPPPYAPPAFTPGAFAPGPLRFDPPSADPNLELDESELEPDEELAVNHAVLVAPIMIVTAAPPQETLVMTSSPLSAVAAASAPPRRPDSLPPQPPAQLVREVAPENGVGSAEKSAPHPLGVIAASSSAMRMKAASIADLDLEDNGATTISETIFDEPPQPRRRSEPPKIRPKAPAPPRFSASQSSAAATQIRPRAVSAASLPRVTTPPPGRVRQA